MQMPPMPKELIHINTDGIFIKIWGICDNDKMTVVRDTIDMYTNKLVEGANMLRALSDVIPGKIVLAFYNCRFHRAEIIQMDGARSVVVNLIDLGIKTAVDVKDIRTADGIFNNVSRSGYAEEFILQGAVAKRPWDPSEVESANACLNHCTEILLSGFVADKKVISVAMSFNSNVMHLSSFLVSSGLAEQISNDNLANLIRNRLERKPLPSQFQTPPPSMPNIPITPTFAIPQQTSLRATAPVFLCQSEPIAPPPGIQSYHRIRVPRPVQNAQATQLPVVQNYIYTKLTVGTTHEVYISFVIDGMSAFTIQLKV